MIDDLALKSFLADARRTPTLQAAGLRGVDEVIPGEVTTSDVRRRRLRRGDDDGVAYLSLVRGDDGLLWWQSDDGPAARPGGRRAGRRGITTLGLAEQYKFETVHGSQVAEYLEGLDRSFNPNQGLRLRTAQGSGAVTPPAAKGRILLIVHGTFSHGEAIADGLSASAEGKKFLERAFDSYDQVLSFEHPTLSVSPIINAVLLARAFATTRAKVDVVCHSRGGLVVRWWLEVINQNASLKPRVVFVGSPLQGTSLASASRLRTALNLMTNVVVGAQQAASLGALAMPLFGVIAGLMKLLASVSTVTAKTPLIDAAVAMIPGLAAQSRRGAAGQQLLLGNFELDALSAGVSAVPADYFVVKSAFEPTDVGWEFWKFFMKTKERLADFGADLVFPAENDLVVDTASMDALSDALRVQGVRQVYDFGTSPDVHHLNYFAQPATATFLTSCFGLK